MTSEPQPSLDDAPLESAVESSARPALPPLEPRVQLAVGAGLAVAIIGLLGTIAGAWSLSFSGVILIAAGLVGAGAAYLTNAPQRGPATVPLRDLILGGGTIAGALGILYVAEILTDLDDIDTYGGVFGLVMTIGLGIAGVALYVAATRWWSGGPAAPWTTVIAPGGRPTRLVLAGAALVLIGWLGNVTIGFWYLDAGTEVVTFILLAALVMRAVADPEQTLRLPLPPAYAALASAIIAAIIAIQHTSALLDQGGELVNWLAHLLYVVGVVLVLAGSGLAAAEGTRTLTEDPSGATPQP